MYTDRPTHYSLWFIPGFQKFRLNRSSLERRLCKPLCKLLGKASATLRCFVIDFRILASLFKVATKTRAKGKINEGIKI